MIVPLSPISVLSMAICRSVAKGPSIITAGSPGISFTNTKLTRMMPKS